MALADYGFRAAINATNGAREQVLSLEQSKIRNGYAIRQSNAASGLKARAGRFAISSVMAVAGLFLMLSSDSIVAVDAHGAWLLFPIGAYLLLSAVIWFVALCRPRQEVLVDKKDRAFHLVKRGWRGAERSRQTIRFEEVVKLSLVENLASLDMRATAMNWDMARIDVTWREKKVSGLITGDLSELEPLCAQLRREAGIV